jgi:hypothetical protein
MNSTRPQTPSWPSLPETCHGCRTLSACNQSRQTLHVLPVHLQKLCHHRPVVSDVCSNLVHSIGEDGVDTVSHGIRLPLASLFNCMLLPPLAARLPVSDCTLPPFCESPCCFVLLNPRTRSAFFCPALNYLPSLTHISFTVLSTSSCLLGAGRGHRSNLWCQSLQAAHRSPP